MLRTHRHRRRDLLSGARQQHQARYHPISGEPITLITAQLSWFANDVLHPEGQLEVMAGGGDSRHRRLPSLLALDGLSAGIEVAEIPYRTARLSRRQVGAAQSDRVGRE